MLVGTVSIEKSERLAALLSINAVWNMRCSTPSTTNAKLRSWLRLGRWAR